MKISVNDGEVAPSIAPSAPERLSKVDALPLWPPLAPPLALNVIAVLLAFCVLYFAASLLAPIACAVLLSMMLSPPVRFITPNP